MRKIILMLTMIGALATVAYAETLTLTTYYPAPFGAYDQLRLVPRATLSGNCQIGTIYVQTPDRLFYCQDNGGGGGIWGTFPGVWTQNGDNIYPNDTASNPNLKVGIGTTAPNRDLVVNSTGTTWISIRSSDTRSAGILFGDQTSDSPQRILTDNNNNSLQFWTRNLERVHITSQGEVGVGTSTPGSQLDVSGTNAIGIRYVKTGSRDARIQVADPTQAWSIASGWATGGDFSIVQEGVAGDRIYIRGVSGNVGIKTTTPLRDFHVNGDAQANNLYLRSNGTNVGLLRVGYSGGSYYATYAP